MSPLDALLIVRKFGREKYFHSLIVASSQLENRMCEELFLIVAETSSDKDFSIVIFTTSTIEGDCLKMCSFLSHHNDQMTRDEEDIQIDAMRD